MHENKPNGGFNSKSRQLNLSTGSLGLGDTTRYQPLSQTELQLTVALDELFETLKIHLPTTTERGLWTAFVTTYLFTISWAAFYSLSEYSTKAAQDELTELNTPSFLVDFFDYAVKGASIVPMILGTNSARTLFSTMFYRCQTLYQQRGLAGLLEHTPVALVKTLPSLLVAFLSSFGAGNVTRSRLMEDNYLAEWVKSWCVNAAMISATITNGRVFDLRFTDLLRLAGIQATRPVLKERLALQALLVGYPKRLKALVEKALDATVLAETGNALQAAATPLLGPDLATHFKAMHGSKDVYSLVYNLLVVAVDNKTAVELMRDNQAKPVTWSQWLGARTLSTMALLLALAYTIPNYVSASKAQPLAEEKGFGFLPVMLLALASYAANTVINNAGIWSLLDWASKLCSGGSGNKQTNEAADYALMFIKGILVTLYMVSQVGIVRAFPFEIDPRYNADIAIAQLPLTAVVSMGLALFSISSALQVFADYRVAYQTKDDLAGKLTGPLTKKQIRAIENHLNTTFKTLQAALESLSNKDILALYQGVNQKFGFQPDVEEAERNLRIADDVAKIPGRDSPNANQQSSIAIHNDSPPNSPYDTTLSTVCKTIKAPRQSTCNKMGVVLRQLVERFICASSNLS